MAAIEKSVAVPPVLLLVAVGTCEAALLLTLGAGEAKLVIGIIEVPLTLPPPPGAADIRGKGMVGIIPPLHIYGCEPISIPNCVTSTILFQGLKSFSNNVIICFFLQLFMLSDLCKIYYQCNQF